MEKDNHKFAIQKSMDSDPEVLNEKICALEKEVERLNALLAKSDDRLRNTIDENSKNQKLIEAIFNSVPGMIYLYDDMGKLVKWNKRFELMTGFNEKEILNKDMLDWFKDSPENQKKINLGLNKMALTGYGEAEATLIRKNGQTIPMLFTATPLFWDDKEYITGVGIDISTQKKAFELLTESEEKYRELFENNPQPMWIFDSETLKFLEINDAACKHYGYSCDEFLAMDITMIRPKEEMHILYANLERMNKGVRTEVYARHLKKDGSIIEVELTSSPTISNGRKAMHVMVNDITERKIANERLQKSRDILNKLLLESSELIQTTNSLPDYEKLAHTLINISEARFVSFNLYDSTRQSYRTKAMAGLDNYVQLSKKILGFNLLDYEWKEGPVRYFNNKIEKVSIYKNIAEISGKQIPGLVVKLIENTFNTGKVVVVNITNMEEILGHFLLIYPKNKQPENLEILELYGSQVGQFITRKRTEEKVLESEKKYRYLFTSNPQPMWIYDVETLSYIEVNDAAIRHYGYSLDEFMKMTILDIRPKDEKEQIIESVRNQGEMDKSGDWTHIKKNGERILVEITSYSVVVNGRKARHVLINDITERRKAEIALKEKMDELLRFHKVTVGRELTMIELKKEINTLLKSAGKEEKYRIV